MPLVVEREADEAGVAGHHGAVELLTDVEGVGFRIGGHVVDVDDHAAVDEFADQGLAEIGEPLHVASPGAVGVAKVLGVLGLDRIGADGPERVASRDPAAASVAYESVLQRGVPPKKLLLSKWIGKMSGCRRNNRSEALGVAGLEVAFGVRQSNG